MDFNDRLMAGRSVFNFIGIDRTPSEIDPEQL